MLRRLALRLFLPSIFILSYSAVALASTNATTVDVTASGGSTKLGATVTLTATVTDSGDIDPPGTNNLTGSIVFYDNSTFLAIVRTGGTKTSATATFKTAMLAVGTHPITAKFFTDSANFADSLVSTGKDFAVTARATSTALAPIGSKEVRSAASATATVTDEGGNTQGAFADSTTYALQHARHGHVAVLLPQSDGTSNILVVGGTEAGTVAAAGDPELFSGTAFAAHTPATGAFVARTGATATLLQNGKVLIAGGFDGTNALDTADIYDPVADSVTATGALQTARQNHAAVLLSNGNVLIIGGANTAGTPLVTPNQVEVYDPATGTFTKVTGDLAEATGRAGLSATLLSSGPNAGNVLIVGGGPGSFEIYSMTGATTGTASAPVSFTGAPSSHTATLLPDGNVVLTGGGSPSTKKVWLYDAADNSVVEVTATANPMNFERAGHTATALPDGTAVIIGGLDNVTPTPADRSSAEIYSPSNDPQGPVNLLSSPDGIAADDGNNTLLGCALVLSGKGSASCSTASVTPNHYGNGTYQITAHYPGSTNHTGHDSLPQTLTITKRTLTVDANTQTKTYDSTTNMNPALLPTVGGTFAGDTVTAVQTYADKNASGGPVQINASVTSIIGGSVSVIDDYNIQTSSIAGGITPRNVTVTAKSGQSKVYGEADPALDYDVGGSGLAGADLKSDAFTGALSRAFSGVPAGQSIAAGPYNIGQGSLLEKTNSNGVTNYNITLFTPAQFAITKRPIGVKVTAGQSKVYGEADPATLVFTGATVTGKAISGLATNPLFTASGVPDDEAAVFSGALVRAQAGTPVGQATGTYAISVGTVAVKNTYDNYDFQIADFTGDNLTVTKRPIGVKVTAGQSKIYGEPDPATFTFSGTPVTGQAISGLATNPAFTASGVADDETAVFSGSLVRSQAGTPAGQGTGSYAINVGTVGIKNTYNHYDFQIADFAGDTLTVNKRRIGVQAGAGQTKVYGEPDPTLAFTGKTVSGQPISGLATNSAYTASGVADTESAVFSGALSRAQAGTPAGQGTGVYAINVGTLAIKSTYNHYDFQTTDFAGDNVTITKRPIGVQVKSGQTKVYGQPDPALAFNGATVSGKAISGLATNPAYTASGVPDTEGAVFTGSLVRAQAGTAAGQASGASYAISVGSVAVRNTYNHYDFQPADFAGDSLAITKRPIKVQVAAGQAKIYGQPDPSTFAFSGAPVTGNPISGLATDPAFTASGAADNETAAFTGALARAQAGTNSGQAAGTYAISQNTVAANAAYPHYDIQEFGGDNFTVNRRPIGVKANPGQTKVYGENDPATFTFTATDVGGDPNSGLAMANTESGLADGQGDVFTVGALSRSSGQAAGAYPITRSSLDVNHNYDFQTANFVTDNYTITKRPIGAKVNAGQRKVFGQADPAALAFTATSVSGNPVSGLATANTASGGADSQAAVFSGSPQRATGEVAGTYAIGQNTVAVNANYDLQPVNFVGDNFTIAQASTVTAKQTQAVSVNSAGAYKLNVNVAYDAATNGGGCNAQLVGTLGCTPDNTITIKEGSTTLDTQTLVSGAATSKALTLAPGQHLLSITYNAGSNFLNSTRSVTLSIASPPPGSISPSTSASVPVPNVALANSETTALPVSGTVTLTSDTNGNALFTNIASSQLGCAIIWSGRTVNLQPTCTVTGAPSSIAIGSSSTVTINIFTSSVHAYLQPPLAPEKQRLRDVYGVTVGLPAIVVIGLSVPKRRTKKKLLGSSSLFMLLALMLALGVLAMGIGCGGGSFDNPTNKQPVISATQTETGSYTAVVYYAPTNYSASCAATTCQPQPMATVNFSIAQ